MADVLKAGVEWLAAALKAGASQTVVYRRGALFVTLQATLGSKVLRVTDSAGRSKVERADLDFILTAADLDFGAGPVDPVVNDQIDLTIDGVANRYDVQAIGSEPHFRKAAHGTLLRVHTKHRGTL